MILFLQEKLKLFKKLFPQEEVKEIKENSGAEHYIVEINNEWICKISKNLDTCRLKLEADLLKILQGKLKTETPKVIYYEPHFLVYKKIPGIELTIEDYEKLNEVQKNKLSYDIAYFLYEFHNSIFVEDAKKLGLKLNNWPWCHEELQKKSNIIEDEELHDFFKEFIEKYKNIGRNDQTTIIHNDMILRNIIIDEYRGQLKGIIDFTDVALDNPYVDLRLTYKSISNLSELIAKNYARLAKIQLNMKKIYIYYMATEFSRYLQYAEELKINELPCIKNRIVNAFEKIN